MNIVCVAGQLGKDAEVRYLANGDAVCNFSVADSQGKDKPTIWWNCSLFGKRAESLAPYLLKGGAVTVSGNVTEREYKANDGTPRKSMEIRVQDVALQGGRPAMPAHPASEKARKEPPRTSGSGFDDMDDDIPF